jgi:hypothetical protein
MRRFLRPTLRRPDPRRRLPIHASEGLIVEIIAENEHYKPAPSPGKSISNRNPLSRRTSKKHGSALVLRQTWIDGSSDEFCEVAPRPTYAPKMRI